MTAAAKPAKAAVPPAPKSPAPGTIGLKEYDWDKQNFVQVAYPTEPVAAFVDFFRTTKAWVEDAARVERKVRELEQALAAYREAQAKQGGHHA